MINSQIFILRSRGSTVFSFPRSAWECRLDALRRAWDTERRASWTDIPTQSVGTRNRINKFKAYMFVFEEVEHIISLQQQSYELLKWVNHTLQQKNLNFGVIH